MNSSNNLDMTHVPPPPQPPMGSQPVGSMNKESETLGRPTTEMESIGEYEPPKEVSQHVKVKQDTVDIPPDLRQLGVSHPPQDQSVQQQPVTVTRPSNVPLSDDAIQVGLKKKQTQSIRWLAEWCVRQFLLAHQTFKKK